MSIGLQVVEECFLYNKAALTKPNGGSFTTREIDIISCILNGGTAKAISRLLNISHHTVSTHIGKIRNDLNCSSQDQIIKFVESSANYIQIRERYIDLLLFNKFAETLEKIRALKISPKYKCVVHANVEEIDKYVLLNYLRLANVKIDISRDSADYAEDKFHIICRSTGVNLENLNADNIAVSENHCNDEINLTGRCVESNGSGTQYNSYFSLLGCIRKIYSSKNVDDILDEFKGYYQNIRDKRSSTNLEQNHIEITDKRKSKYVTLFFITLLILLIAPMTMHWYNETRRTVLTNINISIGREVVLERKDLITKMDAILKKQKGIKFLVLVGQGGIGKTTLARHYVHMNGAKVKWEINAATQESAMKSFLELAIELSKEQEEKREELRYVQAIEDPEIKIKSIISFVFSQLNELGSWCLLFDSVDDFKMIYRFISHKDLRSEGTIIITTRNANCTNVSFIPNGSILNIEYLKKSEKKKLFYNVLYGEKRESPGLLCKLIFGDDAEEQKEALDLSKSKIEEVDKFLENIPPMPLDVSNAAYYIKNTNDSFDKYLEILKSPSEEADRIHSKFLNEGAEYNETRYKMTVAVFKKLIEINSDFKELLLFICLLNSKNIPRKYLDQCKKFEIVSDFISNLKRFFSISLNNGRFSIHKSIQEIGLTYLANILTKAEKEAFLKRIISIMTPYSAIFWQKYKTYPYKMKQNDIDELEMHIESMINNLKLFKLPASEENKYITKLLLAMGFIYGEDNSYQTKYFLSKALKRNESNGYIENYEYAILLLTLGYACLNLDEFEDAKLWLNKGLEFCNNLIGTEILKAYGLCDLGRCYAKTNEFKKAIALLEKALSIVDDNQENWACETSVEIYASLSGVYADHYINKSDGNNAIVYVQKFSKKLRIKGILYFHALAKAYNRMGNYDSTLKCANSYYSLYKEHLKNGLPILGKTPVDIEYGHALLRKGKLISAFDVLSEVISKKQELDSRYLFYAIVGRIEILIRLNKLNEAYLDFKYAISQKSKSEDNYNKLLICIALYNAFTIKYRQKDYKLALKYFSEFCKHIKEFCKEFLSASKYNELLRANVFEAIEDESQIKTCLQNSLKIFSSIFGKDHSFVKEYVSENAKSFEEDALRPT